MRNEITRGLLLIGSMIGTSVLGMSLVACGSPFGNAPLVLTEVPNGPSGREFMMHAARQNGCEAKQASADSLMIRCPDGEIRVPMISGPPTFAVQCVDARLSDFARCRAMVRKMLLAGDPPAGG